MAAFWFTLALLFFLLWLNKKPAKIDQSEAYRQGYQDGYRAYEDKLQGQLDTDEAGLAQLETLEEEAIPVLNQSARIAPSPVVEMTPEQREAKTVRNLNTILYVASFLLVAAAAVFVAASMPTIVRLIGLWAVAILFYGAGLILHQNIQRLRPAAVAFLGTGLAILPFAGYALYLLGGMSGQAAWLVTSAVGLIAYFTAAIAIKSQVVSYLTMAFTLSLAMSSVAVISAPIVWYFVLLIGVSLLASTVSFLKPTWLPELFRRPIESTGQVVTPLALLGSLVIADHMSLAMYQLVFAVAAAHYFVVWLQTRNLLYETIVRIVTHLTLLLISWDIARDNTSMFAVFWLGIGALQALYSLARLQSGDNDSRRIESGWLGAIQGVILGGSGLWMGGEHSAAGVLASFIAIGIISILSTLRLQRILWAIPALVVSLVAPFIVGRWVVHPAWEWQIIAWVFIIMAASVVIMYSAMHRHHGAGGQRFLQISFWLYLAFSNMTVFGQLSAGATGWVAIVAALLAVVFSFLCRQMWAEVVGGLLFVLAIASWVVDSPLDDMWQTTLVVLVSASALFAGTAVHHVMRQIQRRDAMLILAQTVLAGLLLTLSAEKAVVITSLIILLVAAVASLGLRTAAREKSIMLQQTFTVSYMVYTLIAWFLSFNLEQGWAVLVYGIAAVLLWAASYIERVPMLVIGGNIAFVAGAMALWQWLGLSVDWRIFGVAWITAALLYVTYWLMTYRQDVYRQQACLVSVWILLGGAALSQFVGVDMALKIASAGTLVILAGTVGLHGYRERQRSTVEIGVYLATFGIQRMVGLVVPELNVLLYAHWWAITIGAVAWWRQKETSFVRRVMIAMAFITAGTGLYALSEGGWYQLLFLIEHIGLLVIGALTQKTWALWWGVAATVAAVLYFLKDYPYIALAFLGLVLIAIVIWRLIRPTNKDNAASP